MENDELETLSVTDQSIKKISDLRWVDIDELKPYGNNPREHVEEDVRLLMHSLSHYGWRNPLQIQKGTNVVIAGHGRLEAARRLGLRQIPVVETESTDVDDRGYRIMDNASAEMSRWSLAPLRNELAELDGESFNLGLTGFSEDYLKTMIEFNARGTGEIDPDNLTEKLNKKCPRCGFEFEDKK